MTEHCLTKLREGLSSRNMLDVVNGLDRDLLHDTIVQYASPSLLQEFLDTPYPDPIRPYTRLLIPVHYKMLDIIAKCSNNLIQQFIVVSIIYRICFENMQFLWRHKRYSQVMYDKLDHLNSFPDLITWVGQVRILFNQAG